MRGNSFGEVFTVIAAGESHGPCIITIVDGVPSNTPVTAELIQNDLDRRRPGQNEYTTPRDELDSVKILAGVYEDRAADGPIALEIPNTNTRSKDYQNIMDTFRPGHADITRSLKYGIRNPDGGGRSSYRVMASAVAAGAIAKQLTSATFTAFVDQVGSIRANIDGTPTLAEIDASPIRCPDLEASERMQQLISEVSSDGDSIGGVIKFIIENAGASLGEPIFNKLNNRLGSALLAINAVTGVEFGDGFATASMLGSEYNDAIIDRSTQKITTATNHSGGIQGGISTGMPIVGRVAFHAPTSIAKPQRTINSSGEPTTITVEGRHDACVLPRAVPAVEAMSALVIADFTLLKRLDRANYQ